MARLIRPAQALGGRGQAALFHRRDNRLGRNQPEEELFRTHFFTPGEQPLPVHFPLSVRQQPVTLAWEYYNPPNVDPNPTLAFLIGGNSTSGEVFGFGVNSGNELFFQAGTTGDKILAFLPDILPDPTTMNPREPVRLVYAVNPGTAEARIWMNGDEVFRAVTASGTMAAWAGNQNGLALVGTTAQGLVFPRAEVYVGQTPRQSQWGQTP